MFDNQRFRFRMSSDEPSPAALPEPVEDVHGDGRWMSQVRPGYSQKHQPPIDRSLFRDVRGTTGRRVEYVRNRM